MNWITKEHVKQEAAKGKMEALKCSLEHHNQGATCKMWELLKALEEKVFDIDSESCACCAFVGKTAGSKSKECKKCPLGGTFCWEPSVWDAVRDTFNDFGSNPTPANFRDFQDAERKVCDYIQGVIDKESEPEVTFSIGDRFVDDDGTKFMLNRTQAPPKLRHKHHVTIVQLDNGDMRGNPSCVDDNEKIRPDELKELCMGLELTRYYDAAKQQLVGPRAKPKSKRKGEPELDRFSMKCDLPDCSSNASIHVTDTCVPAGYMSIRMDCKGKGGRHLWLNLDHANEFIAKAQQIVEHIKDKHK